MGGKSIIFFEEGYFQAYGRVQTAQFLLHIRVPQPFRHVTKSIFPPSRVGWVLDISFLFRPRAHLRPMSISVTHEGTARRVNSDIAISGRKRIFCLDLLLISSRFSEFRARNSFEAFRGKSHEFSYLKKGPGRVYSLRK